MSAIQGAISQTTILWDERSEVRMDSPDKEKAVISIRRKEGNCGEDGDDIYNFRSVYKCINLQLVCRLWITPVLTVMKAFLRPARTCCLFYILIVVTKMC